MIAVGGVSRCNQLLTGEKWDGKDRQKIEEEVGGSGLH